MAINQDILNPNTNWENMTKGYVEDGLKELLRQMLALLENGPADGSIGMSALTQQVKDLLNGALQSNSIAAWAKAPAKPEYNVSEIKYDNVTNLLAKLTAMDQDIQQALGGGTITQQDVEDAIQNAIDDLVDGAPETLDTLKELATALNNTPNAITALTNLVDTKQDALVAGNGIVIAQDGKTVSVAESIRTGAGKGATAVQSVSVESEEDGTVDIHVDDDKYTINLNHEHQGMAKLAKFVASNPPASMANGTIYAQVDNLATPTEIQSLWLFGCEFVGGIPDTGLPQVTKPYPNSVINLGDMSSSGASKTIEVKGRNLTGDLTVTASTGLTLTYNGTTASSVTIPLAQALLGAQVTITYGGTDEIEGTLVFTHANNTLSSVTVVTRWGYNTNGLVFHLDGADATSTEWVDRKGGIAFAMNNVTLDGNGGVVFNGTNSYGRYAAADSLGFMADTHTIEVVANIGGSATALIFMQNRDDDLAVGLTGTKNLIFAVQSNVSTEIAPLQRKVSNFERGLITASFADTVAYKNKVTQNVSQQGCFDPTANAGVFIGARDTTRSFLQGTIYQIRVYNRLLTSAEILANQQIDIERYNIS